MLTEQKKFVYPPNDPDFSNSPDSEFVEILIRLHELRLLKVSQRGESPHLRVDPTDERGVKRSKLGLWADLNRKWERIDRYLFDGVGGDAGDLEDDFMDLANYAIKGLQLLRRQKWQ